MKKVRLILLGVMGLLVAMHFIAPRYLLGLLPISQSRGGAAQIILDGILALPFAAALSMLVATFTAMRQEGEGLICVDRRSLLWRIAGDKEREEHEGMVPVVSWCKLFWRVTILLTSIVSIPAFMILLGYLIRLVGWRESAQIIVQALPWIIATICGVWMVSLLVIQIWLPDRRKSAVQFIGTFLLLAVVAATGISVSNYIVELTWQESLKIFAGFTLVTSVVYFLFVLLFSIRLEDEEELETAVEMGEFSGLHRRICPLTKPC